MPVFDEAQKVSVEKKACKCGAQLIRVEYKEVIIQPPTPQRPCITRILE